MTPEVFVRLDSLPLTANGKLDRDELPEPDFDQVFASRTAETPLQQELCEMFSSLLEVPEVGIDDSFFELGGQSLQAMRLCSRIGAAVGVGVSVNTLFDTPTVADLAAYIEAKRAEYETPAAS